MKAQSAVPVKTFSTPASAKASFLKPIPQPHRSAGLRHGDIPYADLLATFIVPLPAAFEPNASPEFTPSNLKSASTLKTPVHGP